MPRPDQTGSPLFAPRIKPGRQACPLSLLLAAALLVCLSETLFAQGMDTLVLGVATDEPGVFCGHYFSESGDNPPRMDILQGETVRAYYDGIMSRETDELVQKLFVGQPIKFDFEARIFPDVEQNTDFGAFVTNLTADGAADASRCPAVDF
ncbi:MAG: hypothetical protein LBO05_06440 [Deltaproteobacteria bacterium]|jgi:hypothetical protein|nr:hypothetical protein [Deltaproteobacteria bacterium]